uniref:Aspartyl proteinase n=1 Tax=Ganoderma boninense TaxID=34458 RepID=A0A5K1JYJ6_9APHY|nr:Aspartyl proteinase [Ganoderma boninense]
MEDHLDRILSEAMSSPSMGEEAELLGDEATDGEDPEATMDVEDEDFVDEDERPIGNQGDERYSDIPTIFPRSRFEGICNVETIKDVNFLGPRDEFVVSGSDDGNWFMWEKDTGKLHDILEGDGSVVNVIEGHPYLPLVALFASTPGPSRFSRLQRSDSILRRNAEATRPRRSELSQLFLYYRLARRMAGEGATDGGVECTHQ